jgi:probable DNA repair protein
LQALGWPGERSRTSEEFQTIEAWQGALDALAQLERITPALSFAEALEQLRRTAATPFQPASMEAPVQVLGMLEAAGASFDYLWLMGLSDEVWPSTPRPNPLLPVALQRTYGVPRASAERELVYSRMITERLLVSAPNVVVSHPEREGDRDLFPSPLITGFDEVSRESLDLYAGDTWVTKIYRCAPSLETLPDPHGPALDLNSQVSGGARMLRDQAACPFRAFAAHRLGARPLNEPALGLDASARGILVHATLERLWSTLRSHRRLCDLTEDALRAQVSEAVDQALSDFQQQSGANLATRFYALERQRIEELLLAWLALERRRAPFEVVALEEERELVVGGLTFRIRVDRVDRLLDTERYIIIDYKTNKPAAPAWYDERLEQPQLPLYSVYNQENASPAAVLLAHVRHGGMEYRGAAVADSLVPGLKCWTDTKEGRAYGSWEELLLSWKTSLDDLAKEIRSGKATIDPKSYPGTCEYCDLTTMCRRHEIFGSKPSVSKGDA